MSEILFPHTSHDGRPALRLRLAVLAALVATAFGGFSLWLGASYVGLVGGDVNAEARVLTLGDSLAVNSSVKFRGLRVGRVVSVDRHRDGEGLYTANIVVEDQYAEGIPANVVTRVVPGTLFGAEYVDLRLPEGATAADHLEEGVVLAADTSEDAVRLMDTFSALYRVIDAVDPEAVDMAVSQLAGALEGRGDELHDAVGRISTLVGDYAAAEPTFYRDLDLIAENLDTLADVEPDLAAVLRNSVPVAQTIADKSAQIADVIEAATALSDQVSGFLEANGPKLARLLDDVAPVYDAFVAGTGPFNRMLQLAPTVLSNGAQSIAGGAIQMLAKFSVRVVHPYTADDCPRYGSLEGRNCR